VDTAQTAGVRCLTLESKTNSRAGEMPLDEELPGIEQTPHLSGAESVLRRSYHLPCAAALKAAAYAAPYVR
jgi:hypothetical protein